MSGALAGGVDRFLASLRDERQLSAHTGAGYAREILSDALQSGWNGPLSLEPHLNHSGAVAATGPSGEANQEFKNMSAEDCFHVAAQEAKKLLQEIGAQK